MSKASKSAKKFTLKKKEAPTPISTTPESNEIVNNNNINNNETDSTKSILKKKKVEKVEKKKVIFKTEKNQTQLFNKTLKIADKPLVIKTSDQKKTTPIESEQQQQQQPEEPIVVEKPTAKKSKKQAQQQNNKKEEEIVQQPMVIEQQQQVTETVAVDKKKKSSKKVVVESDSSSDSSSDDDDKVTTTTTTTKKEKKKENNTISGFIILPVTIENSPFKKYIYYKKETNKKWPQNKTLFVTNLPTHCTTLQDVQKLFKYDFIESVHFGQPIFNNNNNNNNSGFEDEEPQEPQIDESTKHVAHIVMKDQDSLNLFLKKSTSLSIQQPTLQLNGFDQLLNQYKSNIITDFETLQTKLDNIMIDYDKRVLETKKRSKQRQVPDEDGFITVGPSSAKVMTPEEAKAYIEKKTQKNFYAFQHRQNKKDELDILRAKFEEDKQKISKISAERKFKPY